MEEKKRKGGSTDGVEGRARGIDAAAIGRLISRFSRALGIPMEGWEKSVRDGQKNGDQNQRREEERQVREKKRVLSRVGEGEDDGLGVMLAHGLEDILGKGRAYHEKEEKKGGRDGRKEGKKEGRRDEREGAVVITLTTEADEGGGFDLIDHCEQRVQLRLGVLASVGDLCHVIVTPS